MPKIDCIGLFCDDICLQFCRQVDYCPKEVECAYRMRIRETIENIRDDNTNNGVDKA